MEHRWSTARKIHGLALLAWLTWLPAQRAAAELRLEVEQITHGPRHHFFGYIGQSLTTPWNRSGRYLLALRTEFHDRMPTPNDPADVVLIDTQSNYRVVRMDRTLAWNFQQGTMFYWNPQRADRQFFFNDRDPETQRVFTVLFDVTTRRRIREYRFEDVPVANGGVAPSGEFYLALNYGRIARLRPVTGYPGATDPTAADRAPTHDGLFRVEIATGERALLAPFRQLRELLQQQYPLADSADFYINHSLCSRDGSHCYFFARGRVGNKPMAVNVPFSICTDGTGLRAHPHIGGHPEWDLGSVVIGAVGKRQVRYDVKAAKLVGQIAAEGVFSAPEGDVALAPNADWFVNGSSTHDRQFNRYTVLRRSDGAVVHSRPLARGPYQRGVLRIDPAPRWNRTSDMLLVSAFADNGTRQLFTIRVVDE